MVPNDTLDVRVGMSKRAYLDDCFECRCNFGAVFGCSKYVSATGRHVLAIDGNLFAEAHFDHV